MPVHGLATKKKGAKAAGYCAETVNRVETLSIEDVIAAAVDMSRTRSNDDFLFGGLFSRIRVKFQAAKKAGDHDFQLEGCKSFAEFCDTRLKIDRRKADYLATSYVYLADNKIPWEPLKNLSWCQLRLLVAAKAITAKNVAKIAAMAEKMGYRDLEAWLKSKTGKATANPATLTFKVHDEQKAGIKEALEKAKKETGTEVDTVALHNICQGYLGNAITIDHVPAALDELRPWLVVLTEKIAELHGHDGAQAVLDVFGKVWPKITVKGEVA